jgi:arginyl-tRNA synthetase
MSLHQEFRDNVQTIISRLVEKGALPEGLATNAVSVEPPRDSSHGDLSTNAAMVLAKPAKMKPRDIADLIKPELESLASVASVEIAGPGFINIRLEPGVWEDELRKAITLGVNYGDSKLGGGEKINVEFVSANPTGPMHVGHCRGAVFGDVLANMLAKAGFDVTREYYVNDAGGQITVLAKSALLRYREALGESIGEIPEGLYPGDYLVPVGQLLKSEHGAALGEKPESEQLEIVSTVATDAMLDLIREDLDALGITFDTFSSETSLHARKSIDSALAALNERGLIYEGILEPPKGKKPDDWEPREQTLFRSSQFGDDTDRPLKKSDGTWTYFAADIAYHDDKIKRGFSKMIDVWGADHGGYVKRMKAAVNAISNGDAELDVKLCQMVKLMRAGEPVKMSKRSGDFVTLREVVDEVGRDVVRFIMLTRKNDAPLDFDFAHVVEQTKDNPVFYVQYAHARVRSVMRKAAAEMPELDLSSSALAAAPVSLLEHSGERVLLAKIGDWPRSVEAAATSHEPHRIAFYLAELAAAFHAQWNQGTDDPNLRFLDAKNPDLSHARLALIQGVASVIASGLNLMGVTPVEEMR